MQGNSCSYTGIGDYAGGRFESGLAQLTQGIHLFESAGDIWEVHLAHFHKGCCQFGLGNLADAIDEAKWVFDSNRPTRRLADYVLELALGPGDPREHTVRPTQELPALPAR